MKGTWQSMWSTRGQVGKGMPFNIKAKLDPASKKMGEEMVVMSRVVKCSRWTKVEMVMVKAKKATIKEACEVKKVAKLVTVELGSTKKLPKMPKGEKEETSRPLNPRSAERRASTKKEFLRGKLPRTLSKWWNKSDPPMLRIQMKRRRKPKIC